MFYHICCCVSKNEIIYALFLCFYSHLMSQLLPPSCLKCSQFCHFLDIFNCCLCWYQLLVSLTASISHLHFHGCFPILPSFFTLNFSFCVSWASILFFHEHFYVNIHIHLVCGFYSIVCPAKIVVDTRIFFSSM